MYSPYDCGSANHNAPLAAERDVSLITAGCHTEYGFIYTCSVAPLVGMDYGNLDIANMGKLQLSLPNAVLLGVHCRSV